jgi:hypothetical protein
LVGVGLGSDKVSRNNSYRSPNIPYKKFQRRPIPYSEIGNGRSHQHALHRTPRGPSPPSANSFSTQNYPEGNTRKQPNALSFSLFRYAASLLVEAPQLMNNLLLRMVCCGPGVTAALRSPKRNPKTLLIGLFSFLMHSF